MSVDNKGSSSDSSIIFLKNIIDQIDHVPHPYSRNQRRSTYLSSNNQNSTKEGTSIKPIYSKTIDCDKESISSTSNPDFANKTQIKSKIEYKSSNLQFKER